MAILIIDRAKAADSFKNIHNLCIDVVANFQPTSRQSRSKEVSQAVNEANSSAIFQTAVALGTQRRDKFNQAKLNFLESFDNSTRFSSAAKNLKTLGSENSDQKDLLLFQVLFYGPFYDLQGTPFRKLSTLLLARADFFQSSSDILKTIRMITEQVPGRELKSTDIAILQIAMLKALHEFKNSADVISGFKLIFSNWAQNILLEDLYLAVTVAAHEAKNLKNKNDQILAGQIARKFAIFIKTNQRSLK